MIRRIYTTFISLAFVALAFTSCSDWLNLYPADEIKEEFLFSSRDGFRTATNGIYRKLSTFELYGSNMTWGVVDAWGQSYYTAQLPIAGGGKAMLRMSEFKFKNSELAPTTDAMWNAAWNIVANCNNLAQQVEVADHAIFKDSEEEQDMILGEVIGLRAFIQFDLLRMYAPAPASVNYQEDSRTFIPYIDVYPSYVNEHQTVSYCLDKIISDLKKAQSLLFPIDHELREMKVDYRFSGASSGDTFGLYRGYRLNYYAVTAELARVYMYAGKKTEALAEANKLIEEENKTGYFKASASVYNIRDYGNIKMFDDIIFALYSPTELTEWDYNINHASDNSSVGEYYICIHKNIFKEIYGEDAASDWRAVYQLTPDDPDYVYYYRAQKYYKQPEEAKHAKINNQLIPMIRMSEIYYIAAEAIFDTDSKKAWDYLQLVKKGRGLKVQPWKSISKEVFMDLLVNDARREFFGEGQIMYLYKRLNRPIKTSDPYVGTDLMPIDKYAVVPLPDSELNIQ